MNEFELPDPSNAYVERRSRHPWFEAETEKI